MSTTERTILVVEDERPLLNAIRSKFEKNGYEVVTAREVDQALDYLNQIKIDVVWLDHYLLGKKDGLDLVTEIKGEGSKYRDVPIFVVSNTASDEKVTKYINLGVEKYYTKAAKRLDEMVDEITNYLDNNK